MKKLYVEIVGRLFSFLPLPQRLQNLFFWPLATRILGKNYLQKVRMKAGFSMYGGMDDVLTRFVLFLGPYIKHLWEPSTTRLLEELSKTKKRILIAGSHIGYMALVAAKATSGEVVAFEPVSRLYELSSRNFGLNEEDSKIRLVKSALGDVPGAVDMYVEDIRSSIIPYSGGHSREKIEQVPITTIDAYTADTSSEPFDLIFLDIEGYELHALQGAVQTLRTGPDLILEVSPKILKREGKNFSELYNFLRQHGYSVQVIKDNYQSDVPTGKQPKLIFLSIEESKKLGYDSFDYFNIYATQKP